MNILAINGSPKGEKSNTLRLTKAFLKGMTGKLQAEGEEAKIETLEVRKLQIRPCLGCFSCWRNTPGECCIKDDMKEVIEKLLWADIILWSFPLYYFSVPGPLKNLIDRQLPMNLPFMVNDAENGGHPSRYDMSGKRHVVISTCGFYRAEGNYDGVDSTFSHFLGEGGYEKIYCGQGELFSVQELAARTDEYLSYAENAGKEFLKEGIREETREALEEMLYPREVFEAMADASWGVGENGEREDESLSFTRQMAALYNKNAYPGKDLIVDMNYTDLGKTYRMILTKDGSSVTEDLTGDFTTRINTPYDVWCSIARGEIGGAEAMMKHLYSVEGDFDLMLHWDDYFSADKVRNDKKAGKTEANQHPLQKTNMDLLLFPFIIFWVAAAIHSFYGSLISLAGCVIVPLIFHKNRMILYEKLAGAIVSGCSISLLLGLPALWILPLSYLCFGILWSVTCFLKVPLTAHYSCNEYGGEAAYANPIFMKTNRILTAAWGILYLITPIWTFFIMKTPVSSYVGAINSVVPALMGIFTAWFQKWYPEKVARG